MDTLVIEILKGHELRVNAELHSLVLFEELILLS
jgi:hypothetical protein